MYPGFVVGFKSTGICINKPSQFIDTSSTRYGIVDSWYWDFGVPSVSTDTAHTKNPTFTYPATGTYNAQLVTTSSKGCIDTASVAITIIDKPPINLAFRDTLICSGDNLQLQASGTGVFTWTPGTSIINANTSTPTVNPANTIYYYVNLNEEGCLNDDSVRVRVVDFVTLKAFNDTIICQGDAVQLNTSGDGLHFSWTPAANLNDPGARNPVAVTNNTTTYQVVATIGHCSATDYVTVRTVPYPIADAGIDKKQKKLSSRQSKRRAVDRELEEPISYSQKHKPATSLPLSNRLATETMKNFRYLGRSSVPPVCYSLYRATASN
jgi:PKD repeat protein